MRTKLVGAVLALLTSVGTTGCATQVASLPGTGAAAPTPRREAAPSPSMLRIRLPRPPLTARPARVVHVTDGDTIVLHGIDVGEIHAATGGRKTRLIGVDTPEVFGGTECYGRQASEFTKRELGGTNVSVDFDIGHTDRFGRALVYIWDDDGHFFNGRLAQEGYALQLTVPPNVRYVDLFGRLVREAREAHRGLWSDGC